MRMKNLKQHLVLLFITIINLKQIFSQECPSIARYLNILPQYYARSFLKLPKTNLLVVNTVSDVIQGSSVVYYIDISMNPGIVITTIRPDFLITQMEYMLSQNSILVANNNKIIIANPYTLQAQSNAVLNQIVDFFQVQNTNYIVVTLAYNQIVILDSSSLKTIKILDNTSFLSKKGVLQISTQFYTLSFQQNFIICSDEQGLYAWKVNFEQSEFSYNGYIPDTLNSSIKKFEKHPKYDILIVGGLKNVKFIQIQDQKYTTLSIQTVNFSSVESIIYQSINSSDNIIIGDSQSIFIYQFSVNPVDNTIESFKLDYQVQQENHYDAYKLIELPIIVYASNNLVTFYNYQSKSLSYNLNFSSDYINKSFIFQNSTKQEDLFLTINQNNLVVYQRSNLGVQYQMQKQALQSAVLQQQNSFYRVKNCGNCFFIKTSDSSNKNYIVYTKFDDIKSPSFQYDIGTVSLTWSQINQNLDPFILNDQLYVVFSQPNQITLPQGENYYFYLLQFSAVDLSQIADVKLTTNQNQNRTSLAVYDSLNKILYGIDSGGTVYKYDIQNKNLVQSFQINGCLNAYIGEIFIQDPYQFLIFGCQNNDIIAYNLVSKTQSIVTNLYVSPFVLQVFSSSSIIALGDIDRGSAKIFKLNTISQSFDFFIEIFSSKGVDILLSVDLLSDSNLLLQFKNGIIFFQFSSCLQDINNCLGCNQNYYFKIQDGLDSKQSYGQGKQGVEFITSQSFLTAVLKAQIYKNLVRQLTSLDVNMYIDKANPFILNSGLLIFDFSNIISLSMQCTSCQQSEYFSLYSSDQLLLQNFVQFNLNQVSVNFTNLSYSQSCGLKIQNIQQNSKISNIQIISSSSYKQNCNQIFINNSTITINNYQVTNQDFSKHNSIITISKSAEITLTNFGLSQCTLGRSFSILSQLDDVKLNLDSVTISGNTCAQNVPDDSIVSSLFVASLFSVKNFYFNDNDICNTVVFTTAASIKQANQTFSFNQITVSGNTFVTKTSYILFNALYSMISKPAHQVIFNNLMVSNNKLNITNSQTDQQISSLIYTTKISDVTFTNTNIVNQTYIFLSVVDTSNQVQISNFNCTNEPAYNKDIPFTKRTAGCLYFIEVSNLNISTLNIINKQTIDENLIRFESYFTKYITINVQNATFANNNQSQLAGNAPMNPLYIMIMYNATINILNSNFTSNNYYIKEKYHDKFIVSTNGIGTHFLSGNLNIKNCNFKNSTSNAGYNYIYVQGDSIYMEKSTFIQSSFTEIVTKQAFIFKNYGGNLYLQVKSIFFTKCYFSQSTAAFGSFIYAQPFSSILEMYISDSTFNEGYASNNGGAIYLYPSNTIQFNCDNCNFTNIYTISVALSAATIGLENSASLDTSRHSINFNGGVIKNIYGNGDNNFIYLIKVDLQINDFQTITIDNFNQLFIQLVKKAGTLYRMASPAQLVNIQNSSFQMTNCNLTNWSQNRNTQMPLLLQSLDSKVTITNSSFTDSKFKYQVMKIIGGSVQFSQVTFTNFSQIAFSSFSDLFSNRFLQQLIQKQPLSSGNSLILVSNSKLILKDTSLLSKINCTSNCQGSSLQILNTTFTIQDTSFSQSSSNFGGAIFVQAFTGQNQIKSCSFTQNTAKYDGGSLYLNAGDTDVFNLIVDSNSFTENISQNGKGGAIYIYSSSLNTLNQNITIYNNQIQQNQAMVGGALSSENIAPNSTQNQISNNKALIYGNNEISYPTQLGFYNLDHFLKENKNSTYVDGLLTIKNFRSGDKIPTLALQFKNEESIIYPLQESEISMYSIQVDVYQASQNVQYDLVGKLVSVYDKDSKSFVFTDVQAVGTPETSQYFEFKSNNIKILDPITYTYVSNYSLKIKIEFRSCQAGEEILKYKQLTECSPCAENTFSLDLNGCQPCPDGAKCSGGQNIIVESGYWRSSLSSSKVIKCNNALSNCLEGSHGNQICYEGHIGALCEECDTQGQFWLERFAKSGDYSCTNCNKITGNLYIVILMTVWTMISMTIAIRGDIDTLENAAGALTIKRYIEKNGSSSIEKRPTHASMINKKKFGNNQEDEQRAGTYVKMLTNYLQIVNTLASFNLTLPSGIYSAPEAVGRPLQQSMNSLDCALAEIKTDVPIIYLRVMFSLIIPLIYLLLFFFGIVIAQLFNRGKPFPWYIVSTGIMFLIIYVQPDLVSQVISLLSCRKIGDEEYILGNVSYMCHNEQHNKYSYFFLIPVLFLWIFLIPFILWLLLWRKVKSLDTLQVKLKYGFLYKEYQRWYWEFVKMAEKIAIILVLNFFYSNVPVKGLISFQIIVIYGLLAQRFNPYKEEFINKLDVYSTNCSAASILIGVFIYDNSYNYLVIIGFIMLIILNAWYIISLVIKILSGYIYKIKGIKKIIIEKLAEKIDYFKKYLPKEEQKRKMNPEVRQKMRNIFNKFIKLPPAEKKAVILKIYEEQLTDLNNQEYDKAKKKVNQFFERESQNLNQKAFSETTVQRKSDKIELQQKALDVQNIKFEQVTEMNDEKNVQLIVFEPDCSQLSAPKKTETSSIFQKRVSIKKIDSDQTPKIQQESPFNGFDSLQNPEINKLIKIECQKMQSSDLNLIQKIN
ncbi:transmembrane protein, putative (macronuclear) [Tetrahymena thermophila SB210]|uniref:Transmembrane protein, putative n=1 Tax=Tetrahymena thermophila (strain SB210) TaxID=312017 RepID=I7MDN5_TETTS|nr:transmembrane protein, putative [Tetrahymena thermophila SB210]EAR89944.2 transmembrane protein, putative [Tetrahymena thermophila SB210]|eukprot:XP_001010189.2 transmembrane protein, putative [Tetrahymena thermophila SB210]